MVSNSLVVLTKRTAKISTVFVKNSNTEVLDKFDTFLFLVTLVVSRKLVSCFIFIERNVRYTMSDDDDTNKTYSVNNKAEIGKGKEYVKVIDKHILLEALFAPNKVKKIIKAKISITAKWAKAILYL